MVRGDQIEVMQNVHESMGQYNDCLRLTAKKWSQIKGCYFKEAEK